jgi:hypothetical protein
MKELADKVDKWGSDPNGLCKAADALRQVGFDEETVSRWVRMRTKVEARKKGK